MEYHDPSGVFPLISKDLASRLPLRNLNWKSPTRPLRSIGALHVEFVPDAATAAKNEKNAQLQRLDSTGSAGDVSSTTGKERRHQIPGLLQTPYLKIYLLRCDDKDAYKATSRQLLRDWIRENTPTTQSSSQVNKTENHDACEWLILHVVIPDTVAASEPRWTAASKKDPDELVERPQSTAKWPGKSTRTVLDKIRADFNATSKSAPERVAQLRLQKKDVPPQVLPQTPVPSQYTETPQEQDNAWQDLVSKFKTLILMSFDLRVSQYEDDLREKDTQRSLPGWNFCTFFTLKEGLARGFESVGLVEDALAIYDELSAGLDTAVRENVSGGDVTQSTFLGDMKQYADALRQALDSPSDAEKTNKQIQDLFGQPLDLTRTDYRGGIVKNTISLFDFHLYIFARQRTLLLRLAAGLAPAQQRRPQSSQAANKDDNFAFSAEVCRRAAAFAATDSRVLRKSLHVGYEYDMSVCIVENSVDSFVGPQTHLLHLLNSIFSLIMLSRLGHMPFSIKSSLRQRRRSYNIPVHLVRACPPPHKGMGPVVARKAGLSTFLRGRILIRTGLARCREVRLALVVAMVALHPLRSSTRMKGSANRTCRRLQARLFKPGLVSLVLLPVELN